MFKVELHITEDDGELHWRAVKKRFPDKLTASKFARKIMNDRNNHYDVTDYRISVDLE